MSRVVIWRFGDGVDILRSCLRSGGIVALPTESSYGLAVDPRDARGVDAVFLLKARDRGRPLPVVVGDAEQLEDLGIDPKDPLLTLARHWPAPLSLVLATSRTWPAGPGGSLAVRVPAHEPLRGLLRQLGPLTATSANRAAEDPLLDPSEVEAWMAEAGSASYVDMVVVDGGVLSGGPPSTLVTREQDGTIRILREGAFPASALARHISAESVENPAEVVGASSTGQGMERNA